MQEIEQSRKIAAEVEIKKVDKREILELRQILTSGLENKPDLSEI